MKIAFCLHGKVGGLKSKSGASKPSKEILEKGFEFYNKNLFRLPNHSIDVYIHCWDTELEDEILTLYKPKKYKIEPQIKFKIPSYVGGDNKRKQAHYSKWYSVKESVNLYDPKEYDFAIITRFDIAWQSKLDFHTLDKNKFYVGNWCGYGKPDKYKGGRGTLNVKKLKHWVKPPNKHGYIDFWFLSSSDKIQLFGQLFDSLDEYTKDKSSSHDKSRRISNHKLSYQRVKKLKYPVEYKLYLYEDFPLIRRHYFNCKK